MLGNLCGSGIKFRLQFAFNRGRTCKIRRANGHKCACLKATSASYQCCILLLISSIKVLSVDDSRICRKLIDVTSKYFFQTVACLNNNVGTEHEAATGKTDSVEKSVWTRGFTGYLYSHTYYLQLVNDSFEHYFVTVHNSHCCYLLLFLCVIFYTEKLLCNSKIKSTINGRGK